MTGAIESAVGSEGATPEAERQLTAAVERHCEALASVREPGRPESGQHVAVKALGRAVQLVVVALRYAAQSAVPLERLMELTGWEKQLVDEALARSPDPRFVAVGPGRLDSDAVGAGRGGHRGDRAPAGPDAAHSRR